MKKKKVANVESRTESEVKELTLMKSGENEITERKDEGKFL